MNILGKESATKEQLTQWVKTKKPNQLAIDLIDTYWNTAIKVGVDPIVVYCQSMKETGWMKFGGVLDASFKNPCGLKTPQGGGCTDPEAHTRFKTWDLGIQAQCEHLALYAGKKGYPLKNPVDPRHFSYIAGKCKTVESLSGNWAGAGYGEAIVKLAKEVAATKVDKVPSKECQCTELKKEITRLNKELKDKTSIIEKIRTLIK